MQVGVGFPVGCEAIVHAVAHLQEDASICPEERWVLLLDFSNAFNIVDRGSMFREVRDHIPPWLLGWRAAMRPNLFSVLGNTPPSAVVEFSRGTDPHGQLSFALNLQPIIEKIREDVPSLLFNAWYLDDGTLCGSASDLSAALAIIEEIDPARGLHLNRTKGGFTI